MHEAHEDISEWCKADRHFSGDRAGHECGSVEFFRGGGGKGSECVGKEEMARFCDKEAKSSSVSDNAARG